MRKILVKPILLSLVAFLSISCKNKTTKKLYIRQTGQAEIIVNNYMDANSKRNFENPYSMKSIVDFHKNTYIERINSLEERFFVEQDSFAIIEDDLFNHTDANFYSLNEKPIGLSFIEMELNPDERISIEDTIINDNSKKLITYKNEEEIKTLILNPTDTLYSFSLAKNLEKEFLSVIENVTIYNKELDLFTSIYIDYKPTISSESLDIIEYNNYIKNQQIKSKH